MAAAVQGDGWRKRHDGIKMRLFGLLRWAGVEGTLVFLKEIVREFGYLGVPLVGKEEEHGLGLDEAGLVIREMLEEWEQLSR